MTVRPLLFASLALASLSAQDYVVDAKAGSSGNGSQDAPFATIGRAAAVMQPGDTCWIRAGTYRETVTPAQSGTRTAPITFRSAPGEIAIISGADPLTGWTKQTHASGKVWTVAMPWTCGDGMDQIFVDGAMMVEARWPNIDHSPALARRADYANASAGTVVTPGAADNQPATARYQTPGLAAFPANHWKGARVALIPGALWCPITGTVTASAGDSITFTYPWNTGDWARPTAKDWFYLWGVPIALDAPREWYRDPATGALSLWLPDGEAPAGHRIEAKRRQMTFSLKGRSWITVKDLHTVAGAIETDQASVGIRLEGIDASYMAHYQVLVHWWNTFSVSNAINLNGDESVIMDSRFGPSAGPGVVVRGKNCQVINNVGHDTGYFGLKGPVVGTDVGCDNVLIADNTLWGSGGHNLVDLRSCTRAKALRNDIAGSGHLTIDEGAIMVHKDWDAKDTEIAWNYVHDTDGLSGGQYYGNSGVYFEPGAKGFRVHHNLFWNTGSNCIAFTGPTQGVTVFDNLADGPVYGAEHASVTNHQLLSAKQKPAAGAPVAIADRYALPFLAGAMIGESHLRQITIDHGAIGVGTTFTIGNLPPGRMVGANFKLKLGANPAGGTVSFRDGRFIVSRVPCTIATSDTSPSVQIGEGKPLAVARRKRGDQPPASADPTAGATPEAPAPAAPPTLATPKPEVIAAYDAKLIARLGEVLSADRPPLFRMRIGRSPTTVRALAIDAGRTLRLQLQDADRPILDVPWKKLGVDDRRELAEAMRREFEAGDNALVGFYRLLAGDQRGAEDVLRRAGEGAAGVRAAFAPAQ